MSTQANLKQRTEIFWKQIISLVEIGKIEVTDISTIPSRVLPMKQTNHIDSCVCKNINQSEPESQIIFLSSFQLSHAKKTTTNNQEKNKQNHWG